MEVFSPGGLVHGVASCNSRSHRLPTVMPAVVSATAPAPQPVVEGVTSLPAASFLLAERAEGLILK